MVVVLEDDLVDSCKSGEDIAYVTYNCTMSVFTLPFEISAKQSVSIEGFFFMRYVYLSRCCFSLEVSMAVED